MVRAAPANAVVPRDRSRTDRPAAAPTATDVLVFAKAFPPATGGVETYSADVAGAWRTTARRVVVVTQAPGPAGVARRGGVVVVNVGPGSQPVVFLRFMRVLRRLARDGGMARFRFVHATTWRAALPVALAPAMPPLAVTVHGREVLVVPAPLRPAMRYVLARARAVVGVSETSLRAAKHERRGVVAYNGLSFPREAARGRTESDGPVRILTLCRLVERKNVARAIEAVARLRDRGLDGFRYRIAGTGPLRAELERLAAERGLQDRIEFLGFVPDDEIVELYRATDIFLHPQIAARDGRDVEGFGLAISDAMSFGAAVVAGKAGGPADFVRAGVTGLLVDGEDVDAIADALAQLVGDPQRRREIARLGREWALANLSWERHVAAIDAAVRGAGDV